MDTRDSYREISGTVRAVIFRNDDNGYTVLRLDTHEGSELTVVGCIPYAAPGEALLAGGEYTQHPQHGRQFTAQWAQSSLPATEEGIYEYLASGAVKGIGPATATLLVSCFGDSTLDILESEPERLSTIRGISLKKARQISDSFKKQMGLRRLMEFLNRYGLHPGIAMRVYACYGDDALEAVKNDPYILASDQVGVSFGEADALAMGLGFEEDSPERICAAVLFELRYNSSNGHVFIPREKLIAATAQLLDAPMEQVEECLDVLIESEDVIQEPIAGVLACYLRRLWYAEKEVSQRLRHMAQIDHEERVNTEKLISRIEKEQNIRYAPMQKKVLEIAASRHVLVLTGGPGTGKTTCVRALLALFDKLELDTVLAAPTGRAAKRMTELTGRGASTMHRLLEAEMSGVADGVSFRRNAGNPLRCDAVILDECSMVDITLMNALLSAMKSHCRLVLVGDADQLPSVGPGNVFGDIIRSGRVETVRLTEIFRQTEVSRIVSNAHSINRGEHPPLGENKGDFFFMRRREPARTVDTIVELCAQRLPENMGIPAMDIQVLSPGRKGETGTRSLNLRLQAALNPPGKNKKERQFGEILFREGDRVMQIRNDYDILWRTEDETGTTVEAGAGMYNGDIGRILRISEEEDLIEVDFDGKIAVYTPELLRELEHAYAMTVHKSQGSEYRAVVMAAAGAAPMLMTRGVLYTAVTRARELMILVGDDGVIGRMIDNDKQQRRYSGLRARLADHGG